MKLSLSHIAMLVAAAITITLMAYVFEGAKPVSASSYTATAIQVATTSAATAVTTSTRLMATTTNPTDPVNAYTRVYATICNPNANPVVLNLNGDVAASLPGGQVTTVIAAAAGYSACYEITDRNQYSGSVTASSTNQTSTTVTVQQFVQK